MAGGIHREKKGSRFNFHFHSVRFFPMGWFLKAQRVLILAPHNPGHAGKKLLPFPMRPVSFTSRPVWHGGASLQIHLLKWDIGGNDFSGPFSIRSYILITISAFLFCLLAGRGDAMSTG